MVIHLEVLFCSNLVKIPMLLKKSLETFNQVSYPILPQIDSMWECHSSHVIHKDF